MEPETEMVLPPEVPKIMLNQALVDCMPKVAMSRREKRIANGYELISSPK
jgi:hypothetical protein